jgi:hypothetical protein
MMVVKKEDDNLRRLKTALETTYPQLRSRKFLIVDDEADFASLTYRRRGGAVYVGKVAGQIEEVRKLVAATSYLQVTATPYALYLQPEEDIVRGGVTFFRPKRPAFTEILPIYLDYVGGDYYFERSGDPASPAFYLYEEVPLAERDTLKNEDGRRLKLSEVLISKNVVTLRHAIVNFVMGAAVRRLQQKQGGNPQKKYSFVVHTEQARDSHEWQEQVTTAIRNEVVRAAQESDSVFESMLRAAYDDLGRSVEKGGLTMPAYDACTAAVREALLGGYLMITKVNSDQDIDALLDDHGQLKLRTPMNMFIGGQILDRGVTIENLIGFYYGRNPKKFQQDTVLQHSRMYGARARDDLAVTRFYSPLHIHQIMRKIHEFDAALREAFVSGAHERGVYFIHRDIAERLMPCSPNKVMLSQLTSIRPGKRLLPVGFQTVAKSYGKAKLQDLDERIRTLIGTKMEGSAEVSIDVAVKLLGLAYQNLEFGDEGEDERKAHVAALEHLSKTSTDPSSRGKVVLITATNRDVARMREAGRFSNAPDTKQQENAAHTLAKDIPALMLLRQNGTEDRGWRGLPFWWPVVVVPQSAVTSVFAAEVAADEPLVDAAVASATPGIAVPAIPPTGTTSS